MGIPLSKMREDGREGLTQHNFATVSQPRDATDKLLDDRHNNSQREYESGAGCLPENNAAKSLPNSSSSIYTTNSTKLMV
jgi:hypothetical protein